MAFKVESSPICVVGAGAAGTVLARALSDAGLSVHQVLSRDRDSARRLADGVGADLASHRLLDLADECGVVIMAVPDDQVSGVAAALATAGSDWRGRIAMHVSGALPSAVLGPLRSLGAEIASFHPMLSLHRDSPPGILAGAWINVEGTPAAVEAGRMLAERLGATPFEVDADTKAAIHLAASVASNFLVTLITLASEVLEASGVAPPDRDRLLRPLVAGTLANIRFSDPGSALTGPISRSDGDTVDRHFERLVALRPEFTTVFAALAAETARLAARSGKITDFEASAMLDRIHRWVAADPRTP